MTIDVLRCTTIMPGPAFEPQGGATAQPGSGGPDLSASLPMSLRVVRGQWVLGNSVDVHAVATVAFRVRSPTSKR